jgi:hypothetical protein
MAKIISFLILYLFLKINAGAQEVLEDKFKFINDIKKFIVDSTDYKIDTTLFYSNYNALDSAFYYYVYVSEVNKLKVPKGFKNFTFFNSDSLKALQFIESFNDKEKVSYLYRTAGNSSAKINLQLLSYYNEEMAFIIFHEATHHYIQNLNPALPYEFNESLCDAMGISLLKRFATQYPAFFNPDGLLNFEKALTSIHRLNVYALLELKENPRKSEQIYERLQQKISDYTIYSGFLRERYAGTINSAWMLRNKFYSGAYFYCRMFTGYPSTKITTRQLNFVFGKEKNESLQNMIDKDLYLFMDN